MRQRYVNLRASNSGDLDSARFRAVEGAYPN
jgi:hypothetical protein